MITKLRNVKFLIFLYFFITNQIVIFDVIVFPLAASCYFVI